MSDGQSTELQRLATLDRNREGTEALRVSLDEFVSNEGKSSQYVSARIWYKKDDGQWCPTKKGITIRKGEIHDFGKALRAALDAMNGGLPQTTQPVQQTRPDPNLRKPASRQTSFDDDGADPTAGYF